MLNFFRAGRRLRVAPSRVLAPFWGLCLGPCVQTFDTGGVLTGDTLPMLTSRRIVSMAADSGRATFGGAAAAAFGTPGDPGSRPVKQAKENSPDVWPRARRGARRVAQCPSGVHPFLRRIVAAVARFREKQGNSRPALSCSFVVFGGFPSRSPGPPFLPRPPLSGPAFRAPLVRFGAFPRSFPGLLGSSFAGPLGSLCRRGRRSPHGSCRGPGAPSGRAADAPRSAEQIPRRPCGSQSGAS